MCRVLVQDSSSTSNLLGHSQTFLNHIITEMARYLEFFNTSSGRFDCTELSLTTSSEGKQRVQGAYALVRGSSRALNLLELHHCRCVEFFHMSSGWFAYTEPSPTTSLHKKQIVQSACARVQSCSSVLNLLEPS